MILGEEPTLCENKLYIILNKKESKDFCEKFKDGKLLNHILNTRKIDYKWNEENWGTRYDVIPKDYDIIDFSKERITSIVSMSFWTVSTPPIKAFKHLNEMFVLKHYNGFTGKIGILAGNDMKKEFVERSFQISFKNTTDFNDKVSIKNELIRMCEENRIDIEIIDDFDLVENYLA